LSVAKFIPIRNFFHLIDSENVDPNEVFKQIKKDNEERGFDYEKFRFDLFFCFLPNKYKQTGSKPIVLKIPTCLSIWQSH